MELTEEMLQAITPMMKQYLDVKNQYNDCVLMYRVGDFYEMFFDLFISFVIISIYFFDLSLLFISIISR